MTGGPPLASLVKAGQPSPPQVIDPPRAVACPCSSVLLVYDRLSVGLIECPRCKAVLDASKVWHTAPPIIFAAEVVYLKGVTDE